MLSNKNCNNFNPPLVDRPIYVVPDYVHGKETAVHDGNSDRPEKQQKSVIEKKRKVWRWISEKCCWKTDKCSWYNISDKITNTSICPQYCRHGQWTSEVPWFSRCCVRHISVAANEENDPRTKYSWDIFQPKELNVQLVKNKLEQKKETDWLLIANCYRCCL